MTPPFLLLKSIFHFNVVHETGTPMFQLRLFHAKIVGDILNQIDHKRISLNKSKVSKMFSKFLLVKISIKYLESKSMIIFLRHKWVAGDGVSITSYCRRLCPPPAIPYLEGGDRKDVIFLPSFFWLINFG